MPVQKKESDEPLCDKVLYTVANFNSMCTLVQHLAGAFGHPSTALVYDIYRDEEKFSASRKVIEEYVQLRKKDYG